MNAIEFVKKFGWGEAKSALGHACGSLDHVAYNGYGILISDLKQIVDAWELVERFGGVIEAKKVHYDEFRGDINWNNLQQAINLVEQCQ